MSRNIGASNVTAATGDHLHEVVMVALEFDDPIYVHSDIGDITYDGNTYLGVGHLGSISEARESELVGPNPLTLSLSGVNSTFLREGLDSGSYGDPVTIYVGFRQDDGTLVADPFIVWKGRFEYASISQGSESYISVTLQHDLAILNQSANRRFTDEDQKQTYASDEGFQYVSDMATQNLFWGGGRVSSGGSRSNNPGDDPRLPT